MDNYQDYINRIYFLAVGARLVHTKGEFAALLEVDRSGLSAAMNGNEKYQTKGLMKKVQRFAVANGLEEGEPQTATRAKVAEEDWKQQLIESQQRTIESQQRTIEALTQMQVGTAYMGGVFAPKNSRPEK